MPQTEAGEHAHARSVLRGHDRNVHGYVQSARAERHSCCEDQRSSCRRDIWTDAELGAKSRPDPHHPAQAGEHDTLLEPANQRDPLGHQPDFFILDCQA